MGNFFCVCKDGWEGRLCDKGECTPHPLSAPHPHPGLGAQPSLQSLLNQRSSWERFAGPGWVGALPENLLNSAALSVIL